MIKIVFFSLLIFAVTNCSIPKKNSEILKNNLEKERSSISATYLTANYYISKGDAYTAREILSKKINDPKLLELKFFANLISGDFEVANELSILLAANSKKYNLYYFPRYIINIKENKFKQNFDFLSKKRLIKELDELSPLIKLWLSNSQNKKDLKLNEHHKVKNIHELLILENFYDPKKLKEISNKIYESKFLNSNDVLLLAGFYYRSKNFKKFKSVIQTKLSDQFDKKFIITNFTFHNNIFYKKPTLHTILASKIYNNALSNNLKNEVSYSYKKILLEMSLYLCPNLDIAKYSLAELYNSEKTNKLAFKKLKSISSNSFFFLPSNLKKLSMIKSSGNKSDYKILLFKNIKIWPNNKFILYNLASYYKSKKQYFESLKVYKKIINIHGESGRNIFLYASNLDKIGKWKEAKLLFLDLLKRNPKDTYTLNYVSYKLALKKQDLNLALSLIKQALSLEPENGFFLDTLGWVEFKRRNYDEAVYFLEKSISILPKSSEILDHLGDCYLMLNRRSEAIFEWKKAIRYETDKIIIRDIKEKIRKYE